MLKEISFEGLGIAPKNFFTVFLLLFNSFTWYYLTLLIIERVLDAFKLTSEETLAIWVIYYAAIIGSSIVGSILPRIKRLHFLYVWMILGTISSSLLIIPNLPMYIWSFLLGASFGLGMPLCLAFFADHLTIEHRGRMSGIIFLTTFLSVPFLALPLSTLDLTLSFLFLTLWRVGGLISFALLKPSEAITHENRKHVSFTRIIGDKFFVFYLLPWLMFILVDRFERPVLWSFYERHLPESAVLIEPIIGSFSAFFGGLLSDRIGRKRVVIGGFVALGLAYALIGISPTTPHFWYLYIIVDGIALGIFMVAFILTVWGDLSQLGAREKYYVIGNIPLYLASILQLLLNPYTMLIPSYAAFSLASFFLFLAVLPLIYAPETLPEKKIQLRQLRSYAEAAKKVRKKFSKKSEGD